MTLAQDMANCSGNAMGQINSIGMVSFICLLPDRFNYAPNFGEVEGAYCFGPVRLSVRILIFGI